jgi:hypothetical protein
MTFLESYQYFRFETGPRLPGANYLDMSDISTSKELFPELNPKDLGVMFPPPVRVTQDVDEKLWPCCAEFHI